jgi:hypothetical protein
VKQPAALPSLSHPETARRPSRSGQRYGVDLGRLVKISGQSSYRSAKRNRAMASDPTGPRRNPPCCSAVSSQNGDDLSRRTIACGRVPTLMVANRLLISGRPRKPKVLLQPVHTVLNEHSIYSAECPQPARGQMHRDNQVVTAATARSSLMGGCGWEPATRVICCRRLIHHLPVHWS